VLLALYRYRLPMRQSFRHATASRDYNEGLLVRLELADGSVGLGEGVPRAYVTGETVASAIEIIRHSYAANLAGADPLAAGPLEGSALGVWHNAAWCACELAYLDAAARSQGLPLADLLGRALGRPVTRKIRQRVAGVLSADEPAALIRNVRRMLLINLRDFKLKIGLPEDHENLRTVRDLLWRGLSRGKITLRVDANGAWSLEQARRECQWMQGVHVSAIEQPLTKGDEADMPLLRQSSGVPIMLDESLLEPASAARLAAAGAADYWNLRISKNGGLLQALQLADLAREKGVGLMLGAMVGESGILSAAARVFLQLVPEVEFLENSYGSFLLAEDLVKQKTRFGYGGRIAPLKGPGLGVTLNEEAVERLTEKVAEIKLT
jgi:muconate cycloisomerase